MTGLILAKLAGYALEGTAVAGAAIAWSVSRKCRLEAEDDEMLDALASGDARAETLSSWEDGLREQSALGRVRPDTIRELSRTQPGEWAEEEALVSAPGYEDAYERAGVSALWLPACVACAAAGGLAGGACSAALVATSCAIAACDLSWRVAPVPLLGAYALFGQLALSPNPFWAVVMGCVTLLALGCLTLAVGQGAFGFGDALAISAAVAALSDATWGLFAYLASLVALSGGAWLYMTLRHRQMAAFAFCPLLVVPTLVAVLAAKSVPVSLLGVM